MRECYRGEMYFMKIRVAEYIAELLYKNNINQVFMVVGGGAMHLNDALGHKEGIRVVHCHHEQACAMAAEGYARIKEWPAVVNVTTGPGGTNALTGVLGAWQDSIPMLIISGQVRLNMTVESVGLPLREFGEQEYNIVRSVSPMTKYAYMVKNKYEIRQVLEKGIFLATNGRRGPVWIDIPLDIQGDIIETDKLYGYKFPKDYFDYRSYAKMVLSKLGMAKSPVILAGPGIRRSESYEIFRELIENINIPVLSPTCIADIMPKNHPSYYGNFGVAGGIVGNFLVQNADMILCLGCRLSFGQIGFNFKEFSPNSYKIMIDIDNAELSKPTIKIDMPICADLKKMLNALCAEMKDKWQPVREWKQYADRLRKKFSIENFIDNDGEGVNPYCLAQKLMHLLPDYGVVVTGNSSGAVMALHLGIEKDGQRLFSNIGCGSMGYDLPAALGVAAAQKKDTICITGDGSFMMNIQELQTIVDNKFSIKIIVLNNGGYMGVVRTQKNFFNGRLTGCNKESGLGCPNWENIAKAFSVTYLQINDNKNINEILNLLLNTSGCVICEVKENFLHGPIFKLPSKQLSNGEIISVALDDILLNYNKEKIEFERYKRYNKL